MKTNSRPAKNEYFSLLRPEIIAMLPQNCSAVLDVGCGTGALGRYLKETGVKEVCGRVIRDLIRGKWRYADAGVLDRTHLRFFTWEGIEALFQENGFTLEKVSRKIDSGLNMKLLNLLLCNTLKESLVIQYSVRATKAAPLAEDPAHHTAGYERNT
jgi:hypothetical protein